MPTDQRYVVVRTSSLDLLPGEWSKPRHVKFVPQPDGTTELLFRVPEQYVGTVDPNDHADS